MSKQQALSWQLGSRWDKWIDLSLVGALLFVGGVGHFVAGQYIEAGYSVLEALPLLWRRRSPVFAFAVIAVLSAFQAISIDTPIVGQVAFPIAVYSVARWSTRGHGVIALLVGYAGALVAAVRWLGKFGDVTPAAITAYVVTMGAIITTAWALGFAAQQRERVVTGLVDRADQAERMAQREVQLAAQDERARIAREMHDVVAHGLSVIVVQADGARYAAAADPDVAITTLGTIANTGRESLTEMRRLLGLLRTGDSGIRPQPGLADIADLVVHTRASGAQVTADIATPQHEVPAGVGLAAYRIVQEALTNVRKHAGPEAAVTLRVQTTAAAVEIEVHDDGRGAATTTDGRGLGLLGMRERAESRGGTVSAGPAAGGGFTVSAKIPL